MTSTFPTARAARRRGLFRARGGAVVEFAVVLPLLLAILLGIIQYGYIFMVRLTMHNAAREGCRLAVLQTSVEPYSEVNARIDAVMSPTGLTSYMIDMEHAEVDDEDPVEVVSISIPYEEVSLVGDFFGAHDNNITATCSMRKEGM